MNCRQVWNRGTRAGIAVAASVVAAGLVLAPAAGAAAPVTELVSRTAAAPANGGSIAATASADGRFVVFESTASNLVVNDTNNSSDVFVKDRGTGTVVRANVAADGTQADRYSGEATISADGRYVAFETRAPNLVPGDTNDKVDVFVKDLRTGAVTRASTAADGAQASDLSEYSVLSGDGRHVLFASDAPNLVPGDSNGVEDHFVKNLDTGAIALVNVGTDGRRNHTFPLEPAAISADGRLVSFTERDPLVAEDTNGTDDVYLKDVCTGAISRVIESAWDSKNPAISADGQVVAFTSPAPDLVAGDSNGERDVFVKDLRTGVITLASVTGDGTQANGLSNAPSLSADGRQLVFSSVATNLVPGDTNGTADIFVKDRRTGSLTRASVAPDGTQAASVAERGAVSANGRVVVFDSTAANLAAGDTNNDYDVFVRTVPNPDADLYADAVASGTTVVLHNGNNALGAPDSRLATVVGLLGGRVVLDLGAEEEGTGDLAVHYGGINLGVLTSVDLLDGAGRVVATSALRLAELGAGTHVSTVRYTGTTPYRYVRINAGLLQVFGLDAVKATGLP